MQELVEYYNEKEDTDASLRNYDPEKWDFDNSQDTQADEFDVDTPVHPFVRWRLNGLGHDGECGEQHLVGR